MLRSDILFGNEIHAVTQQCYEPNTGGVIKSGERRVAIGTHTPSRAFCAPRKRLNCVTHVSGMNCHPSLRKGKALSEPCQHHPPAREYHGARDGK
jgi:hypothetical protein